MQMRAARMHGYNEPLRFEEIPVPDVGVDEVLMKVAPACMCRSDFQLVAAYCREGLPVAFPISARAEAGAIAAVGADVPQSAGVLEDDLVVADDLVQRVVGLNPIEPQRYP